MFFHIQGIVYLKVVLKWHKDYIVMFSRRAHMNVRKQCFLITYHYIYYLQASYIKFENLLKGYITVLF